MNDIVKKTEDVIPNGIDIDYDSESNIMTLKNNNAMPLTIRFEGGLNIQFDEDFVLESTGQVDLITHDNMICLDSIDSAIHLNSRKAKKLWNEDEERKVLEVEKEQERAIKRMRIKEKNQMTGLEKLQQLCDNINTRLLAIEQREKEMIEIKNGGQNDE